MITSCQKYVNAFYNRELKEIARRLKIRKRLTTHSGRKTFATLQNEAGWSIESIALMLGHNSIKTTETHYIGRTPKRLFDELHRRA
jgi:integrase